VWWSAAEFWNVKSINRPLDENDSYLGAIVFSDAIWKINRNFSLFFSLGFAMITSLGRQGVALG
jgi:hypothetical protein